MQPLGRQSDPNPLLPTPARGRCRPSHLLNSKMSHLRTKMGSDSTRTARNAGASSAQYDLSGDRSRRPSSAPGTRRNAPVQTEASTTRLFHTHDAPNQPAPRRRHIIDAGYRGTISVSGESGSSARERAGCDQVRPKSLRPVRLSPARAGRKAAFHSGLRDVIVGTDEHLKRPCDIEQLHATGTPSTSTMRAALPRTGVGWKRGDFGISARGYSP